MNFNFLSNNFLSLLVILGMWELGDIHRYPANIYEYLHARLFVLSVVFNTVADTSGNIGGASAEGTSLLGGLGHAPPEN